MRWRTSGFFIGGSGSRDVVEGDRSSRMPGFSSAGSGSLPERDAAAQCGSPASTSGLPGSDSVG
jgi:hypothetical protein